VDVYNVDQMRGKLKTKN